MKPPKISVLIPTYNYGRYLPEAIESVLGQDYADFELLISDDASTDDSGAVITAYAARDRRLRCVIQAKRLGMVPNWNYCLREARGEYVKFVFGDDKLATPQALSRFVALMESNASISLAVSARKVVDQDSRAVEVWDHLGRAGEHPGGEVIGRCLDRNRNLIGEPSVTMFRKKDSDRGFSNDYQQIVDLEMWFHLLERGNLAYTPEPLCCFRRHQQQQTVVNLTHQIGTKDGLRLFLDYQGKAYLSPAGFRRRLFPQLYELRKRGDTNAESRRIERELTAQMGRAWYVVHWVRHKVTKPFSNLWRWFARERSRFQLEKSPGR